MRGECVTPVNKLTHRGLLDENTKESTFKESEAEIYILFLKNHPIPDLGTIEGTDLNDLSSSSDERIAQSVALAYFKRALLRDGVDSSRTEEVLNAIIGGTKEVYQKDILTTKLLAAETSIANGPSTLDDEKKRSVIDVGYAFPVSPEQLALFINSLAIQTEQVA